MLSYEEYSKLSNMTLKELKEYVILLNKEAIKQYKNNIEATKEVIEANKKIIDKYNKEVATAKKNIEKATNNIISKEEYISYILMNYNEIVKKEA